MCQVNDQAIGSKRINENNQICKIGDLFLG